MLLPILLYEEQNRISEGYCANQVALFVWKEMTLRGQYRRIEFSSVYVDGTLHF